MFFTPSAKPNPEAAFYSFYKVLPEEKVSRQQGAVQELSGNTPIGLATLIALPGRIEFHLAPSPVADSASIPQDSIQFAFIEDDYSNAFLAAAKQFINDLEGLLRIGVGTNLVCPAEDHRHGYRLLQSRLSNVTLEESATDFVYKINRQRSLVLPTTNSPIMVNRLCQWRCVRLDFANDDGNKRVLFGAEMEPDVNTAPSVNLNQSAADDRSFIVGELFNFASEFSVKGETP